MLELCVAVGVRCAFLALAHRLKAIAQLMEQSAHRRRTHLPTRFRQRRGELRPTLARPPQRRLRVASSQRVNQPLQGLLDARLRLLDARASRTRSAYPSALHTARFQLPATRPDRRARQPRRIRHQSISSIPNGARLRSRPYPTTALVEKPFHRRVLLNDRRFQLEIASHGLSRTQYALDGNIIPVTLLTAGSHHLPDIPSRSPTPNRVMWTRNTLLDELNRIGDRKGQHRGKRSSGYGPVPHDARARPAPYGSLCAATGHGHRVGRMPFTDPTGALRSCTQHKTTSDTIGSQPSRPAG